MSKDTKEEEAPAGVDLGDRMKKFEAEYERTIPSNHAFLVRLDGVKFSKFTHGLDSVFDMVFSRAMILTMNDLLQRFPACTGYTHSDEITIIFPPVPEKQNEKEEQPREHPSNTLPENKRIKSVLAKLNQFRGGTPSVPREVISAVRNALKSRSQASSDAIVLTTPVEAALTALGHDRYMPFAAKIANLLNGHEEGKLTDEKIDETISKQNEKKQQQQQHPSNGRVVKLATVMAGYASARFNANFVTEADHWPNDHYKPNMLKRLFHAYFDARVLSFPPEQLHEVANHMFWRSSYDCHRNCVSTFARHFWSTKQLHKVSTKEMIQKMGDEKKLEWKNVPLFLKFGTYAKKPTPTPIDAKEAENRAPLENRCCMVR